MPAILQDLQDILRGFKMTLDFNKLFSAFVGIILSVIWVLVILAIASVFKLVQTSPYGLISESLASPRLGLCSMIRDLSSSLQTVDWGEYAVLVVLVIGLLVIWSIFAGSITRMAAVEFARGEKTGLKESLSFAFKKFWSYFWSPLMPVMGVLFFIACNVIGGLLGQIKIAGELAVAIGFPLAILSGFLIVFIGIIGIIGFFLMFPTISAEGSDTFDAISRAYSYVLSRPVHFFSLLISIIVCGAILTFLASCGACLVMKTTYCTVGIGMGDKFDTIRAFIADMGGSARPSMASLGSMTMKFAALMLILYIFLVKVIVGSIVVAFAGSASTIAYLILRKDVDGTEMDDVFIEEKEEKTEEIEKVEEEKESPSVREEETEETKEPEKPEEPEPPAPPEEPRPEPEPPAPPEEPRPEPEPPAPPEEPRPEPKPPAPPEEPRPEPEPPAPPEEPKAPDESSDHKGFSPGKPE